MTGAAATTAADAGPLHCGNCRQPMQREWAADMEAEARRQRGHVDEAFEWSSLLDRRTNPLRALLIALAVWFLWRYGG